MKEDVDTRLCLQGIRVIEVAIWMQGPIASMILGDMGAEVIKIEMPVRGDFSRGAGSLQGRSFWLPDGRNLLWEPCNRNKKSVTLDLHGEGGKQVLYRLVEKSDVFLTNMQPSAIRELGITPEDIREHNPHIIYARAGGFGQRGPDAELPCNDTAGMARSGFMLNSPMPDGCPVWVTGSPTDVITGTMVAFGTLAALLARERLGISQAVYSSQLQSMMWLELLNVALVANQGCDFVPVDRTRAKNPLLNWYKCSDDKWIVISLYVTDRYWHDFCNTMGISELEKDPRFENEEKRGENCEELIRILDRIFASKPSEEWTKAFRERGIWFSVVNRVADLPADVQVIENEYITEFDNGLKFASRPFDLEKTETPLKAGAPELGQHTEEVLTEIGGYTWEEIAAMREQGVI